MFIVVFIHNKKFIEFLVYLNVCSEISEVHVRKYLYSSLLLLSFSGQFLIGVGFNCFAVFTIDTVVMTLCKLVAVTTVYGTL
jgi:hypothetical protein